MSAGLELVNDRVGVPDAPTIDVRPVCEFAKRRASRTVNMPASDLRDRLFELPPKGTPILVVANDELDCARDVVAQCCKFLSESGWTGSRAVSLPADRLEVGVALDDASSASLKRAYVACKLWSPCPLVEREIARVEALTPGRVALDLGCGSGRDAALLASRGWSVVGIENRDRLAAQARGIAQRCSVSSGHDPLMFQIVDGLPFREASFDLVLCVRFLHRPLLPHIAKYIAPGGLVLYSHFVDGVQLVGTPKHVSGYLLHNELTEVLTNPNQNGGAAFSLVVNHETNLNDGRPIVEFLAQRLPKP
jgi:SAM-dependent methyltransferase